MNAITLPQAPGSDQLRMKAALVTVGLPPSVVYKPSTDPHNPAYNHSALADTVRLRGKRQPFFWMRSDLSELFYDARKAYRQNARRLHPDTGGDGKQMAALNIAWHFVRTQFARKGITLVLMTLLLAGCASTVVRAVTPGGKAVTVFSTQADVQELTLTLPNGTTLHMVAVNHSLPSKAIGDNIAKDVGALGVGIATASNFILPH